MSRHLLTIDGHRCVNGQRWIVRKGYAAIDILSSGDSAVRQLGVNRPVVDIDGPAEAGIGLTLIVLDE